MRQSDSCYLISEQALNNSHAISPCNRAISVSIATADYKKYSTNFVSRTQSGVCCDDESFCVAVIHFFSFPFSFVSFSLHLFRFLSKKDSKRRKTQNWTIILMNKIKQKHILNSRAVFNFRRKKRLWNNQIYAALSSSLAFLFMCAVLCECDARFVFFFFAYVLLSVHSFVMLWRRKSVHGNVCLCDFILWQHYLFFLSNSNKLFLSHFFPSLLYLSSKTPHLDFWLYLFLVACAHSLTLIKLALW